MTSLFLNISSGKKVLLFSRGLSLYSNSNYHHIWLAGLTLENNLASLTVSPNPPLSSWWCWPRCRTCSSPPPCPGRPRCSSAWSPPARCRLWGNPWRYRTTSTWFFSELSSGLCLALTVFWRWWGLLCLWRRRWLLPVLQDNTDRWEYQPASRSCSKFNHFLHF